MLTSRRAEPGDLNFLVWIDIKDEGVSSTYMANWTDLEWAAHRRQILAFITEPDKVALVCEDPSTGRRVAAIYADFLQADNLLDAWAWMPTCRHHFPPDGRFCDVFQLWVDPLWRRQGIGSMLKSELEQQASRSGLGAIVTKTEASNAHVIELNRKLGYREIFRGPMWDEIERVALLKPLTGIQGQLLE